MAIALTQGSQVHRAGSFQAVETLSQSTATAEQTLDKDVDVSHLGVGTATGFGVNKYFLASDAVEGKEHVVLTTGTGAAILRVADGTATGSYVFQSDTDMVFLKLINGIWMQLTLLGATLATST